VAWHRRPLVVWLRDPLFRVPAQKQISLAFGSRMRNVVAVATHNIHQNAWTVAKCRLEFWCRQGCPHWNLLRWVAVIKKFAEFAEKTFKIFTGLLCNYAQRTSVQWTDLQIRSFLGYLSFGHPVKIAELGKFYRGADKSLARPTFRYIYICIYIYIYILMGRMFRLMLVLLYI
jgi:hypothetical protein